MKMRNWLFGVAAVTLPLTQAGCIVVSVGSWGWHGPKVWTQEQTEQISLDPAHLASLSTKTHNGSITFVGGAPGSDEAYVIVTKKAGGVSTEDAEEAMEALDVYVDYSESGTRVGWRWNKMKSHRWSARVSFEIKAPGNLNFTGETHNGPVKVEGAVGDTRVVTHNGSINVASQGGSLNAETHNGSVTASYSGEDVRIVTHNGKISADLSQCAFVNGIITTHNGGVDLFVGDALSARLDCRTHNGRISCNVPTNAVETSRRRLIATIGDGSGNLAVTTHNGSVRVKSSTG